MSCERFIPLVDAKIDGLLEASDALELDLHLTQCIACRSDLESLLEIKTEAGALPRVIEPTIDAWSVIETRILSGSSLRLDRHAARLAAVAAAWFLVAMLGLFRHGAVPATSSPAALSQAHPVEELAQTAELELKLRRAVAASPASIDPKTLTVLRTNLAVIDGSIRDIQSALEADPTSSYLPALLSSAYRNQRALLQRFNSLMPI